MCLLYAAIHESQRCGYAWDAALWSGARFKVRFCLKRSHSEQKRVKSSCTPGPHNPEPSCATVHVSTSSTCLQPSMPVCCFARYHPPQFPIDTHLEPLSFDAQPCFYLLFQTLLARKQTLNPRARARTLLKPLHSPPESSPNSKLRGSSVLHLQNTEP